jgi:hypothetical protein
MATEEPVEKLCATREMVVMIIIFGHSGAQQQYCHHPHHLTTSD